jgi:hypothetical protein
MTLQMKSNSSTMMLVQTHMTLALSVSWTKPEQRVKPSDIQPAHNTSLAQTLTPTITVSQQTAVMDLGKPLTVE